MKTFKTSFFLLSVVVFAGVAISFIGCASTGTNIGEQPMWGPTGYDHVEYYYIPDIDSYYSVSEHKYIYRDGSNWTHSTSLPSSYNSSYDPYQSYKVVINENTPYQNNNGHQTKYVTYKANKDQPMIRDSQDPRYWVSKDHPEHAAWVREHKR